MQQKYPDGLSAHVTSWNVEFQANEGDTSTNIEIDLSQIYPGMPPYLKEVTVKNKGETKAKLSYEIEAITVLGELFSQNATTTSIDLEEKLKQYPFKIIVSINDGELSAGTGQGKFSISVEWPFESGNDNLDTYWGEKSFEYHQAHPTSKSLIIRLKLLAEQI